MINVDMNMSKQKTQMKLSFNNNQDDLLQLNITNNEDQNKTQKKLIQKKTTNQGKIETNSDEITPRKKIQDNKQQQIKKLVQKNTQSGGNSSQFHNKSSNLKNSQQNNQQQQQTQQFQQQPAAENQQNPTSSKQQRQSLAQKLKKNKLLGEIFKHFCNMTYANSNKKTFQQMTRTNIYMSLNKFMLFCKQFTIDHIVRVDLLKYKKHPHKENQKFKTEEIEASSSSVKKQKRQKQTQKGGSPKHAMLQIPVRNINNTEKTLTKLYQKNTSKHDQMTYQQFTTLLQQIYNLYEKNFSELYDVDAEKKQNSINKQEIEEKFLSDVLIIDDVKKFDEKMTNLKILFKGAISYHQDIVKKSSSFLNKRLVIHGGRSPQEMRKELEIYQSDKIDKKESWIDKQPQSMGVYSKSRVFYRPNPSTTYQTNEVIRLARKQAGRSQTQSLFVPELRTQKGQSMNRMQPGVSFSRIFEDKTNNRFSKKLLKINHHHELDSKDTNENHREVKKGRSKERDVEISGDDDILAKYFENERKVYGNERKL